MKKICTICKEKADFECDEAIAGNLGEIPVVFCVECVSGILSMVDYMKETMDAECGIESDHQELPYRTYH